MPKLRSVRWGGRRVAACAGGAVLLALTAIPLTAPAGADSQYNTYSASVTGVALKQTYGALSTADDPGTAATQAAVGISPGYNGQTAQLKGVAINADPGTLAGAVLFAAPDCKAFSDGNQGGGYEQCIEAGGGPEYPTAALTGTGQSPGQLPATGYDSGLATASGFPGWAEAFYPQPDQRHVTKCFANKDAKNGSDSNCSQSSSAMYADAQVDPDKTSASGLAISENPNNGQLEGSSLSSKSNIAIDQSGALVSSVENQGSGFAIPNVPTSSFFIRGFTASAQTVAKGDKVSGSASCTIDMAVNGQTIDTSQAQQIISQVPSIGGSLTFNYTPPSAPKVQATDSQGAEASCTGAILSITYPVPDTGASVGAGTLTVTYIFGMADAISSAETNSAAPVASSTGDTGLGSSPTGLSTAPVSTSSGDSGSTSLAPTSTGTSSGSGTSNATSTPTTAKPTGSGNGNGQVALGGQNADSLKPSNGTILGLLTGLGLMVVAGIGWLLVGVVRSISRGVPLRLPGI